MILVVQNHKRVIAFVNDDPDNLPLSDREVTDKMRRKLRKFRKKVMTNKMVKMWHDKKRTIAEHSHKYKYSYRRNVSIHHLLDSCG